MRRAGPRREAAWSGALKLPFRYLPGKDLRRGNFAWPGSAPRVVDNDNTPAIRDRTWQIDKTRFAPTPKDGALSQETVLYLTYQALVRLSAGKRKIHPAPSWERIRRFHRPELPLFAISYSEKPLAVPPARLKRRLNCAMKRNGCQPPSLPHWAKRLRDVISFERPKLSYARQPRGCEILGKKDRWDVQFLAACEGVSSGSRGGAITGGVLDYSGHARIPILDSSTSDSTGLTLVNTNLGI